MEEHKEKDVIEIPKRFNESTKRYEPDLEALEKKVKEMKEKHTKEVEMREKEIQKQEKLVNEIEQKEKTLPNNLNSKKEGSFRPVIIIMFGALLIASLWDKVPGIKNSVHFILDPSAGVLLNWNLNWGMLIIVFIITLLTTIVQKYATDQETLKELKKEQKEIQKQMKEFRNHPEKKMELTKKQMKMFPKQMKLSMRGTAYTLLPFALFFRWFRDYFTVAGNPKLLLGMNWFLYYLLAAILIGSLIRKKMDVV